MKKIVFAIQVFGLITMLPLYLILELTRGTDRLPAKNPAPVIIDKPQNKGTLSNLKLANEKALFIYPENKLLLK